jgi:putative flippase GtrA
MNIKGLVARLFDVARMVRYFLVGIAATGTYLGVFNLVAVPIGRFTPFTGHLAGLAVSIVVSYCGHHAFTFRRSGDHGHYFARYVVITATLSLSSSILAFVLDRSFHLSAATISLTITALYPGISYLLHTLWTFAEHRKEKPILGAERAS